jgi:hypothetical protein
VTSVALGGGRQVKRRFSRRDGPVMAGGATPYRCGIVDHRFSGNEFTGGVARIATLHRRQVCCRLSRRLKPVMATLALTKHVGGVPHHCRGKSVLIMAVKAGLQRGRGDMRCGARGRPGAAS